MCGITGLIEPTAPNGNALRQSILQMTETLTHRGPDSDGIWLDEPLGIALGHRRLAIVDLSPTGQQPMVSSTGRYVITYNGEIYNFPELRRELEEKGCRFRGSSDTEVLLEAIETWGITHALKRCVGMFAFGIWDRNERLLCIARDRLGEKPLYWALRGGRFFFGSELKALIAYPNWTRNLDLSALTAFFRTGYISAPLTIFENIRKLQPGRILWWRPGEDEVRIERFWDLHEIATRGRRNPFSGSEAEATDVLEDLLSSAVRGQMIADVPLGAFLSGGIDSSTVVALMQKQSNRPVRTFSIGFNEQDKNEAHYARAVASHLATDHTELMVTPELARDFIPTLPNHFDEPFADHSQIPTLLVSHLARQKVVVALSGDGGDELFGGYPRYELAQRIWRRLGAVPAIARRLIQWISQSLSPQRWDRLLAHVPGAPAEVTGNRIHRLSELFGSSTFSELYMRIVSQGGRPETFVIGSKEPNIVSIPQIVRELGNSLELMQFIDMATYLPDDILTKVDRATMAFGLEGRIPLLDHRVVEFAWCLPTEMKVSQETNKWLLRQILYRHVPRTLVDRSKMGFGIPLDAWLQGPLRVWAEELLNPTSLRRDGYLNTPLIREKWEQHRSGDFKWHYLIWAVLMFQSWRQKWLP